MKKQKVKKEVMEVSEPTATYGQHNFQEQITSLSGGLNNAQLRLLKLFSYVKNEKSLDELNKVLLNFYRKKIDKETDNMWTEGQLSNKKMEQILNTHKRTKY